MNRYVAVIKRIDCENHSIATTCISVIDPVHHSKTWNPEEFDKVQEWHAAHLIKKHNVFKLIMETISSELVGFHLVKKSCEEKSKMINLNKTADGSKELKCTYHEIVCVMKYMKGDPVSRASNIAHANYEHKYKEVTYLLKDNRLESTVCSIEFDSKPQEMVDESLMQESPDLNFGGLNEGLNFGGLNEGLNFGGLNEGSNEGFKLRKLEGSESMRLKGGSKTANSMDDYEDEKKYKNKYLKYKNKYNKMNSLKNDGLI